MSICDCERQASHRKYCANHKVCKFSTFLSHFISMLNLFELQYVDLAMYRDALPRMPLRDGWKESLQALATATVPIYIFSSGYGDLVVQVS